MLVHLMKTKILALRCLALAIVASTFSSCMTTYDANGHPVQSVDPAVAVAGVAAAGLVGYAIANDGDHHHHHDNYYYRRPYRGGHYYHR